MKTQTERATLALLLIALAAISATQPVSAHSPELQVVLLSPAMNLGGTEQLQITLQHQTPFKNYGIIVNVTDPSGYQSFAAAVIAGNSTGDGIKTLNFPADFSAYPRPPDTNLTGTYTVTVSAGTPSDDDEEPRLLRATSSFRVTSDLNINIISQSGIEFLPGETFDLTVNVRDVSNRTEMPAQVTGTIVGWQEVIRFYSTGKIGEYAASYPVTEPIPEETPFTIYASDAWGNSGQRILTLSPKYDDILVDRLAITDRAGSPIVEPSPGQVVHFGFRARYPTGVTVTSGEAKVSVYRDDGISTLLQADYSEALGLFITRQGYELPRDLTSTTLALRAIISDHAGAKGSSHVSLVALHLASGSSVAIPLFLPAAAILAGSGISFYTLRHTKRQLPIRGVREAILQSGKRSVLITGRKKSDLTSLLLGFLKEDLGSGLTSVYVSFEPSLERLIREMVEGGIDVLGELEKGSLKIVDCSDLTASLELTSLRLRMASTLGKIQAEPFSLYIDALTLPFEDIPTRDLLDFLSELTLEVTSRRGMLYAATKRTRVVKKNLQQIREVFDGLFDIVSDSSPSGEARLSLIGVSEELEKMPIGELKVAPDLNLHVEVPLTSSLDRKMKAS